MDTEGIENTDELDDVKELTKIEKYYIKVAMNEVLYILNLPSLKNDDPLVDEALKAANKILEKIKRHAQPYLQELFEGVVNRVVDNTQGKLHHTRHLISMVKNMGKLMRFHTNIMVKLICELLGRYLSFCLELIEVLYEVFSAPSFNALLNDILPSLVRHMHFQDGDLSSLLPTFHLLVHIRSKLGEHRKRIIETITCIMTTDNSNEVIRTFLLFEQYKHYCIFTCHSS